MTENQRSKYTS